MMKDETNSFRICSYDYQLSKSNTDQALGRLRTDWPCNWISWKYANGRTQLMVLVRHFFH